ncbi:MAG: patatin-like phospholipase family protein [Boseongicola sp.]|nr:patatin-like phospholipase family protein [Boseongicola sp.]
MPEEGRKRRHGIGICLSGGGYRATLFHAGALRRLAELGVLSSPDFRTVSSVSGGSIAGAFLARAFEWPLRDVPSIDDWNRRFAGPLRVLTRLNIRTGAIARSIFPGISAVRELAKRYDQALGGTRHLSALPDAFVMCATDLAFGVNWECTGKQIGDYQAGYIEPPPDWSIGLAVAASSCFPPVFQPLQVPRESGSWRGGKAKSDSPKKWASAMKDLRLTDGGVYDNLGLEPVWKDHAQIFVSDAGGIFDFQADKGQLCWRVMRYQSVQERQTRALRKRWLISSFKQGVMGGAYWGTGSSRSSYDENDSLGYSKDLAREVISEIRTDVDCFSDAEAAVLENHGYFLADMAVRTHCPDVATATDAPLNPPHACWTPESKGEEEIRKALKDSHTRTFLGCGW